MEGTHHIRPLCIKFEFVHSLSAKDWFLFKCQGKNIPAGKKNVRSLCSKKCGLIGTWLQVYSVWNYKYGYWVVGMCYQV